VRPRIAFFDPGELSVPAQKSSGTLIRSVLNESTDFTTPIPHCFQNQALAAEPLPSGARLRRVGPCASLGSGVKGDRECRLR